MQADREKYISKISSYSHEMLIAELSALYDTLSEKQVLIAEYERNTDALSKEYNKVAEDLKTVTAKLKALEKTYSKLLERSKLLVCDRFGTSSETLDSMINSSVPDDAVSYDPLSEDADPEHHETDEAKVIDFHKIKHSDRRHSGSKRDFSKLPRRQRFIIDADKMDGIYGENNWSIVSWHKKEVLQHVREMYYVEDQFYPVIKDSTSHQLTTSKVTDALLKYSFVTPSLIASIMYKKYVLGLPLYRQEADFETYGFFISRQTMSNWIVNLSYGYFGPVYDHLIKKLTEDRYNQADETTIIVIHDGRNAGRKSYIWIHTNSEYSENERVVIYSFEPTRGTDHLREIYKDYSGYITSDAYQAYLTLGKEHEEIKICGCFMHARRRYAESLKLIPKKDIHEGLPEMQAIKLIAAIYKAEGELKDLTPEQRKLRRQKEVLPLVDEYFNFVHGYDIENPDLSEKFRDAIRYSRNQEIYLRRFLEDGHLALDNGLSERLVKPVALGRRNWLHANTFDGAKASCSIYSLVETAKANKANPYQYLKYLLEKMPAHMDDKDTGFLEDMMPWSEAYKAYEAETMLADLEMSLPESECMPKSNKKNKILHVS